METPKKSTFLLTQISINCMIPTTFPQGYFLRLFTTFPCSRIMVNSDLQLVCLKLLIRLLVVRELSCGKISESLIVILLKQAFLDIETGKEIIFRLHNRTVL